MPIRITGWAATTVVPTIAVVTVADIAVDTHIGADTAEVDHVLSSVVAAFTAAGAGSSPRPQVLDRRLNGSSQRLGGA